MGEVIGVCDGIFSPRTGMRAGSGINSMVGSGHTQGDALCRGTGLEEECPVAWQDTGIRGWIPPAAGKNQNHREEQLSEDCRRIHESNRQLSHDAEVFP